MTARIRRSLVIPVYRNEENITSLLQAVQSLSSKIDGLEIIFVVDGSPDASQTLLLDALPGAGLDTQLLQHSRNFGSFAAVRTGMAAAKGDWIAVMAADLQEPPTLIEDFFEMLDGGTTDIVLGTRTFRSDPVVSRLLSRMFWWTYRRFVVSDIPSGGVDVFACSRRVADAILALGESNTSLISQLFWVGFRRSYLPYERQPRKKGSSAWSMRRRLRYMADSLFSFSDLPILILLWVGLLGLAFSGLLGLITLIGRMVGAIEEPGFATIVIAVLFLFSLLIASQGIVGMYLWRSFENSKGRPTAIVMGHVEWVSDHDPGPEAPTQAPSEGPCDIEQSNSSS